MRTRPSRRVSSVPEPYLSVVATARNDDHGGNPLYRMQLFVDGLIAQCDRHRLPAELVLVEWNPPPDRPRLAEVLRWPEGEGWCTVRIIEVPHELHATLEHSDRLPLYQMIAKNVGIRRARGEFVVATNIDILFSDELMTLLAQQALDPRHVYRVDRVDVPAEIDPAWPIERQLAFCRERAMRVNRYDMTIDLLTGKKYRIYMDVPLLARWLSDAVLARLYFVRYLLWRVYAFFYWLVAGFNDPRKVPERARRRLRHLLGLVTGDLAAAGAAVDTATSRSLLRLPRVALRVVRLVAGDLRARWRDFLAAVEWEKSRIRLHTNASGDFTLMSAEAWRRAGGYAELEMYSMHIDGLVLYQAYYAGIREQRLPHAVYHIEHGGGFKPESKELTERLERAAIPQISNEQLMQWIYDMYKTKQPIAFNDADWGFARETLPETAPSPVAGKMEVA
jgi:hypothetical protein